MRRFLLWQVVLIGAGLLLTLLAAIVFLPRLVYSELSTTDLRQIIGADKRIELQNARYQLQSEFRGQLLQGFGGLFVLAGVAAAWQQIGVVREGQITDRFTRATDQLGSDKLDVRLGGIYALERIARNSPADRWTVTVLLAAFVRDHAAWAVGSPDGPLHPTAAIDERLPWLQSRANDVQAAMTVLGRRPKSLEPWSLYLSRTDLRSADLSRDHLSDAQIRHSNLARAWLPDAFLERTNLTDTDLRQANLRHAHMARAVLRGAHLQEADLRGTDLHGADLRGANLWDARLEGADLTAVLTDEDTLWPEPRPPQL
ncbi:pentapeptide repeat-containing protein [Streptomyces sp. NPDC020794]|uniref:pentapeptide repeat-containing protein n=1 Tax=unclassified Streptomyces TaxID=2593676 RepID=UPI0036EEC787